MGAVFMCTFDIGSQLITAGIGILSCTSCFTSFSGCYLIHVPQQRLLMLNEYIGLVTDHASA